MRKGVNFQDGVIWRLARAVTTIMVSNVPMDVHDVVAAVVCVWLMVLI